MPPTPRVLPFASAKFHGPGIASADESQLLLGPSAVAGQLWEQLRRVAPHFRTALLTGEPGSGAESAARVLYDLSPAAGRPFVVLHSAEAEERFKPRTHGIHEGVLFLPEADRLSPAAQAGLLRLLRQRGVNSIRVVAYARRGLRPLISAGTFSMELASSLGVVRIALPALRDRAEDIPLLASHLVQRHARTRNMQAPTLSADLLDAARKYSWPGNLDQLSSAIKWLLDHNDSPAMQASDLEAALEATARVLAPEPPRTRLVKLDEIVQEHIRAVLLACNGNKLRAAEILGISRSTLYRMLESQPGSGSLPIAV